MKPEGGTRITGALDFARFLFREASAVFLVGISFFLFVATGLVLDVVLDNVLIMIRRNLEGAELPTLTAWVFDHIALGPGIPVEIALGFWLALVLALVAHGLFSVDSMTFRVRFLQSFILIWSVALMLALVALFAISLPFELMVSSLEPRHVPVRMRMISVTLALVALALPVFVLAWRTIRARRRFGGSVQNRSSEG